MIFDYVFYWLFMLGTVLVIGYTSFNLVLYIFEKLDNFKHKKDIK